jgi:polyisoprenoid-binding protein YceI
MKTKHTILCGLFLPLAIGTGLTWAAKIDSSWLRVKFTGDSTLHGFSGIVHRGEAIKLAGDDGHDRVRITVPVLSLDTDHRARDKRMYTMFEADSFRVITGEADLEVVLDEHALEVPLIITMHGVAREVIARRAAHAAEKVELELDLALTSFDLTPPSVLGMIKVDDRVHVAVSLDRNAMEELKQQPAGQKELN